MIHGRSISFSAAPATALGFALLPGTGAAQPQTSITLPVFPVEEGPDRE